MTRNLTSNSRSEADKQNLKDKSVLITKKSTQAKFVSQTPSYSPSPESSSSTTSIVKTRSLIDLSPSRTSVESSQNFNRDKLHRDSFVESKCIKITGSKVPPGRKIVVMKIGNNTMINIHKPTLPNRMAMRKRMEMEFLWNKLYSDPQFQKQLDDIREALDRSRLSNVTVDSSNDSNLSTSIMKISQSDQLVEEDKESSTDLI